MKSIINHINDILHRIERAQDVRFDREGDKADRERDALDDLTAALENARDDFEEAWKE